jgi:catechol 2,3-dioxygenase-like lactoylglutathione lyase family enzyme
MALGFLSGAMPLEASPPPQARYFSYNITGLLYVLLTWCSFLPRTWFCACYFLAEAAIEPRTARHGSIAVADSTGTEYEAGRQKKKDMATEHTVHYRFHHRHLIGADVTKTVAFYENTLGAKKVQEMEFRGRPIVRSELDGMPLTISQQVHTGVGSHIGLGVDDFGAAVTELPAKGVEFIVEPTDMGFAKFAFIQDVAGTTLEILQLMEQN